ncbi:DUF2291 domain-containing protein [Pedobacter sp. P351]|uniref:DUF2291 domain-containing protein n=1 Tax=Pedobacter superstes TaxID=3133441 RepID=UPI00309E0C21
MLKKSIGYALGLILVGLVAYNSVYIKKESDFNAGEKKAFDAKAYAREYLFQKVPKSVNKAVDITKFLSDFKSDPKQVYKYSQGKSADNVSYFLVKGRGDVTKTDESNVFINAGTENAEVKLATEYIFGNAARDGSGLISINDFDNTMDLNDLSEEINKLIKTEILPPFKSKVKKGDKIEFLGVIELDEAMPKPENFEIIPLKLSISN